MDKILIIGAGPAGCSAGIELVRKGFEVYIFEKGVKGKDKICGDGFIPDSIKAIKKLGIWDKFESKAKGINDIDIHSNNKKITINCECYTLERSVFDQILRDEFETLGGKIFYNSNVDKIITDDDRVEVSCSDNTFYGDCLILATGADVSLAKGLGFNYTKPSAYALRYYVENTIKLNTYKIFLTKTLSPGYAWIFPAPNNKLNVGVGYFELFKTKKNLLEISLELEKLLEKEFNKKFDLKNPKGWILRTGLNVKKMSSNRVLLIGENIHTTYDFTGEGIGKAMDSGIIASEVIRNCNSFYSSNNLKKFDKIIKKRYSNVHNNYSFIMHALASSIGYKIGFNLVSKSNYFKSSIKNLLEEKNQWLFIKLFYPLSFFRKKLRFQK